MVGTLLLLAIPICAAILGYKLAKDRNREAGIWAALCFFLPVLLIVILCLSPIQGNQITSDNVTIHLRKCPYCAEKILAEAKICKHCGRDVEPISIPQATANKICPHCGADLSEYPMATACYACHKRF